MNTINNKFENHIVKLHTIGNYVISRRFKELIQYIEDEYFSSQVFDVKYYAAAEDFVFRRDITGFAYSNAFESAYKDIKEKNYGQYLLSIKIIVVKLKDNQRLTYYDRDDICETLKLIEEEHTLINKSDYVKNKDILEIFDAKDLKDGPVGFEELSFKEYFENSTRSIYGNSKNMDEKFYEMELKTAVNKGIIYHYIVEADHYINKNMDSVNLCDWVFIAKLLSLYYSTEKKPWTRDMTKDMLRIYYGIKECCDPGNFEEAVFKLTTENLKLIIKKSYMHMERDITEEIDQAINYLINVFMINRDERYTNYIRDFFVVLKGLGQKDEVDKIRLHLQI